MIVFDKAQWHIDAGEDYNVVIEKFRIVFEFLRDSHLLTEEGNEILEIGIDSSAVLHERMVINEGKRFLVQEYDKVINTSVDILKEELTKYFLSFKGA